MSRGSRLVLACAVVLAAGAAQASTAPADTAAAATPILLPAPGARTQDQIDRLVLALKDASTAGHPDLQGEFAVLRHGVRTGDGVAIAPNPYTRRIPRLDSAMRRRTVYALSLLLGTGLLAGCGQKGPLTLPTKPAASIPATPTPPATATSTPAPASAGGN